jgi:uncharacterized protein YheU (UPF0270 family)
MIDKPDPGEEKKPKLLIMDNGPISCLSNIDGALDWFFTPGCDVWMTDMVLVEARRGSPPGGRVRKAAKSYFEEWFRENKFRIKVVPTKEGQAYAKAMKLWEMAGSPDEDKPESSDYGEASILSKLRTIRNLLNEGETVIVVMDDRDGRAAVKGLQSNVDLMGTRTFIAMMDEDYHIKEAATAWSALVLILREELDYGEDDDPVYVRAMK